MKVPNSSVNLIPLQPFSDVQLCVKIQQGFRNKKMKKHIHTQFALQKHVPEPKIGYPLDCAKKVLRGQSPLEFDFQVNLWINEKSKKSSEAMLKDAGLLFSRNSTKIWRVLVYVRVGSFRLPMTVLQEHGTSWLNIEAPRASALSFIDTNLVAKHQNWQFCQSPRHSGPSLLSHEWDPQYIGDTFPTTTAFGSIIEGEMRKMLLSPKTIHRLIRPTKVHPSEIREFLKCSEKKIHLGRETDPPQPLLELLQLFFCGSWIIIPKHTWRFHPN